MGEAFGSLVGLAVLVWTQWILVVSFVGGKIPLTGWRFHGFSVGRGLAYLFFGEPVVLGVLGVLLAVVSAGASKVAGKG